MTLYACVGNESALKNVDAKDVRVERLVTMSPEL